MNTIIQIGSFSRESTLILWNSECDIEISTSIISFIPFTTELYCHTVLDSLGNIDGLLDLFSNFTSRMTIRTLLSDFLSFSMTSSTCSSLFHNTKNCLNSFTNLSLSITGSTLSSFSSFSTTMMTSSRFIKFYLTTHSKNCIFERNLESHLNIFTNIRTNSRSPSSSTHPSTKK